MQRQNAREEAINLNSTVTLNVSPSTVVGLQEKEALLGAEEAERKRHVFVEEDC